MSETREEAPTGLGPRFPCFDGLRAIAATTIVVFHVASTSGATVVAGRGRYLARLDIGVAVFFVVSGFLLYRPFVIAHLGGRRATRWREFWWRRMLRIYPAYWVALTAAIVAFHSTNLHGFVDYVRHYALVQIYRPHFGTDGIVQTWTLAVEVSFYAALPLYAGLVGRLTARVPRPKVLAIELTGAVALYAGGLGTRAALFALRGTGVPATNWLPAQVDLFALGIGLAVLSAAGEESIGADSAVESVRELGDYVRVPLRWLGDHAIASWLLAGVAFVTVCNIGLPITFATGTSIQEMARQVLYGLTALFLVVPAVFGAQDRGGLRRLLRSRPVVAVGVVSYGVFLWHFDWVKQLVDFGLLRHIHELRFLVLLVLTAVLTLATATLSWVVVERPALSLKHRPPSRASRTPQRVAP
jgi:peptidoglycan/LPS O-acetylase OafA/YrhL